MNNQTSWQFYTDSKQAWASMLEAIRNAKESIDLEQFILAYDSVGIEFLDALKERARANIKIRLFCDQVGSHSLYRANIVPKLEALGIEIKFFNSVIPWHPNNESLWFFRDHRKLLIIDKKIGFTGGICLQDAMRTWRESSVRIEGPVVKDMMKSFDVMWYRTYHRLQFYFKNRHRDDFLQRDEFDYVTNAPLPRKRFMYRELVRAINLSKKYVHLTTPYLLPDFRLLRALKKAAERGVDVRLLVPENSNSHLVNIGSGTFYIGMMEAGIKIFRYKDIMIHGKTGVIDDKWSTIGSLNLDNLSLKYNFEGNLVSTNTAFALDLEKQFMTDLENCSQLTIAQWQQRGIIRRFLEILVWPIRKLL